MRRFSLHRVAITLTLLLALSSLATAEQPPVNLDSTRPRSHWDKIQTALDRQLLTPEQGLIYSAIALFEPQRLPQTFTGSGLGKCGTPVLAALEARWWDLSAQSRELLGVWPVAAGRRGLTRAESRPALSGAEHTFATEHFLVHYTLTGADAIPNTDSDTNGIPDYADQIGLALEYSRASELGHPLNWLEPPSDALTDPVSPSYDVYVQDIPVQGLTYPEAIIGDNEHSADTIEPFARSSYISLNNQLPTDILSVTIAHEYNHAIQFGYNAAAEGFDARRWLMEGTATWMEDQVFPDVDDNIGYLPRLFAAPDRSLAHPDNHYASWLLFQYIEEHGGGNSTIRGAWERSVPMTGEFSAQVIGQALQAAGFTFRAAFASFCAANLVLVPCELSPGPLCYEDALAYRHQAGSSFVEGSVTLGIGESVYLPPDGVQPLSCDATSAIVRNLTVAAGGYAGNETMDLQGLWVVLSGLEVDAIPFPIVANPSSPDVAVSPSPGQILYIIISNLTDPRDGPISADIYGLMFSAREQVVHTSTPTPTATTSPASTATTTLTAPPVQRIRLPLIFRG